MVSREISPLLTLKAFGRVVSPLSTTLLNLKTYKPLRLSKQHNAVFFSHILENLRLKKKVAEGMTRVFTALGIPKEAVTVIFYEILKTNWATGGDLHPEKYAER